MLVLLLLVLLLHVLPGELLFQQLVPVELGSTVRVGKKSQVLHLHLSLRTWESLQEVLWQLHFLEGLYRGNFWWRNIPFLEVRKCGVMSPKYCEQPLLIWDMVLIDASTLLLIRKYFPEVLQQRIFVRRSRTWDKANLRVLRAIVLSEND